MVPLQVSARLAHQPVTSQPVKNDSDDDDHDDNDPDYDPLDETEYDEDCCHGSYTLRSHGPPEERRQCLLFESCLAEILRKCEEPCKPVVQFTRLELFPPAEMDILPSGSVRNVTTECPGQTFSWLVAL